MRPHPPQRRLAWATVRRRPCLPFATPTAPWRRRAEPTLRGTATGKRARLPKPPGFAVAALLLALLGGCEDPVTDMGLQKKYRTYQPADPAVFADGKSARPLPTGTVPRMPADVPGVPYAQVQADTASLADEAIDLNTPNPLTVDRDVLESGQLNFEVFCAVCHGRLGNGAGMIVQRGFTRPPSFHVDRLRAAPDAQFFNVITHGYGAMLSYNDRVPPPARWAIVAYVRALQAAGAAEGVPAEVRRALTAHGDRPTTAPTTTPTTAPGKGATRP